MGLGIKGLCGAGNRGKPEEERIFPPRSDTREEVATSRTTHPPPLPSSVPHPQPLSPECPPGLRARSSARQNRGRRRRPGADGRGRGASQTINRRWSGRRPPAKSTFRASTRFPLTKRPPAANAGRGLPGLRRSCHCSRASTASRQKPFVREAGGAERQRGSAPG